MKIRNFLWGDFEGVLDVINRAEKAKGGKEDINEDALRYKLEQYFDAERDCFVAESTDGMIVGIGTMRFIHPDGTGLGVHDIILGVSEKEVGVVLIKVTDARLKEKWSGKLPPNTLIKVERDVYDFEENKRSILEAEDYRQVGSTHWMEMGLEKTVNDTSIPDDIEFRFFDPEHARIVYELFTELFEEEQDRSYENWRDHYHLDEIFFDPTWWSVAWKEGEMVGLSICYADIHEEPQQTVWIDNIGVLVNFRRHGIGERLLHRSLTNFQTRGFTKAIARPDGNDPYEFIPVLERTGFWIEKTRLWYEKVISN